MDIVRAFTYIFDDDDWFTKVVLTAFISVIPVVNFAVLGWTVALIRNLANGVRPIMPGWEDFGGKFTDGLMCFFAALLYNVPSAILGCCISVIGPLFGGSSGRSTGLELIALPALCLLIALLLVYVVMANALLFIGVVRYSQQPEFSVFTQLGENYRLAMSHLDTLIMLVLYMILAGLVFAVFGWIPCIGWLAALALGAPVYGHLQGQAAAIILGKQKRKRGLA